MPVTVGAIDSGTANANQVGISNILIAATDLVLVGLMLDAGVNGNTIDYATHIDAFTLLIRVTNVGTAVVEIWYATGISGSSTDDIDCNLSAKAQSAASCAIFLGAADAPDNNLGLAIDGRLSPASLLVGGATADNFYFDAFRTPGGNVDVGANQTIIIDTGVGGEQVGSSHQDGVDGQEMSWTWSSGTRDMAYAACRIPEPAPVGGGGILKPRLQTKFMKHILTR